MSSRTADEITPAQCQTVLKRYSSVLSRISDFLPASTSPKDKLTLNELDSWRGGLRETVIHRGSESKHKGESIGGYMNKTEVTNVLKWKLKRGKNRPTLLSLLDSNSAEFIKETTLDAFSQPSPKASDVNTIKPLITILTRLKGIGPATATAILSVVYPNEVPFFSDEAFRWIVHDGKWNAKISYNIKEYLEFYHGVGKLVNKLDLKAYEVERVGWTLGQEAAMGIRVKEDDEQDVASLEREKEATGHEGGKEGTAHEDEQKTASPEVAKRDAKTKTRVEKQKKQEFIDDKESEEEGRRRSKRIKKLK